MLIKLIKEELCV